MNAEEVVYACEALGLAYSRVYYPADRDPHIQISCPLAADPGRHQHGDTKPSCSITVDDAGVSLARCHGASCGFRGTFVKLIEEGIALRRLGRVDPQIKGLLAWLRKVERPDLTRAIKRSKKRSMASPPSLFAAIKKRDEDVLSEAVLARMDSTFHPYAESRGIDAASWDRWGLRFDERRGCVVFPVRDRSGRLIGLTGRHVNPSGPKSYNYPGLRKGRYIFGEHLLVPEQPIVLVEGPIDCVNVDARVDGVGALATLGEGFTESHEKTVRAFRPPKVFLFPDGDAGGRHWSRKIARALVPRLPVLLVPTPDGYDPASLPPEKLSPLFAQAKRVRDFRRI